MTTFDKSGPISGLGRIAVAEGLSRMRAPMEATLKLLHDEHRPARYEDLAGLIDAFDALLKPYRRDR